MALAMATEKSGQPTSYAYAYRSLPAFFLIPASFASESECDAFFASLRTKLEVEWDGQRAYIDKQCRFWPCQPTDAAPCPDPVCQQRRARVDAQLKSDLDELPAIRAQVRIVTP